MLTFVGQRVYGLCFLCEKDVKYRVLREATLLVFDSPCIEFLWYYFLFFRHLFFFSLSKPKNWQSWISIKTLKVSLFQEKKSVTLNCMWATYLLHELLWGIFAILSKCTVAFPWMYCIFISFISLIGTLLCSLVVLFWF